MSTSDRAWFSNQGVKEALQREIESPAFGRLFQELKRKSKHLVHPEFAHFFPSN